MIMAALALLRERPRPTDADIDARVTNACRCGTYHRVRQAIHLAADLITTRAGLKTGSDERGGLA
jgi:isoquinoline 1-oxidoreductase alpha subunit